jgi:hypothetical protein
VKNKTETNRVGVDVWWDNNLQKFRKKRINLEKIPLKYRCPNCGKILANLEERSRNPITTHYIKEESEKDELIRYGHTQYIKVEEPNPFYYTNPIELNFYGGVCRSCWLDGFGKNGKYGLFIKYQLKKDQERFNKNKDKTPLWINDKLRLTKGIIDIT